MGVPSGTFAQLIHFDTILGPFAWEVLFKVEPSFKTHKVLVYCNILLGGIKVAKIVAKMVN